jgi:hypothetical protein
MAVGHALQFLRGAVEFRIVGIAAHKGFQHRKPGLGPVILQEMRHSLHARQTESQAQLSL